MRVGEKKCGYSRVNLIESHKTNAKIRDGAKVSIKFSMKITLGIWIDWVGGFDSDDGHFQWNGF